MKIIIISSASPPEPTVEGLVHWDIANYMADGNNEVWLVSPYPSRPLGTEYSNLKSNRVTKEKDNFVHVNINSFTYPKYSLLYRTYECMDFGIKAIRYINREIKKYDLIYSSPWPFLGQLLILILRKNKKAPLIMNVQDLYPESFLTKINSKVLKFLFKPLYLVDKYNANRATHLTVISKSLKQVYLNARKINQAKISVIHNWQDESEFVKPIISKEHILEKYNLKAINGKFIFMYLGNIGPVAGVETIINAFAKLNLENSTLIIAGSGSLKERCQSSAKRLEISNLFFLDVPQGLKPVVELQSIADILLLPILPEAANSSIPSKLIAYMLSSKPIITSASLLSETAMAIEESKCGWITKTNDISEWTKLMKMAFETNKTVLQSKGKLGFEYALKNYSKKEGLNKINHLFYKLKNS